MRLTLRTLLAYLDDRLSPANTKELGQKIAASPFATELVERIREVKRRRRLALPDKPVAMIDPNLVAEYLDDQLTPELVARVEQQILASDVMLAEVASAHEILGQLRDPVTVEPRLQDRLYSLDPTGTTDVVRALTGGGFAESKPVGTKSNEWKPLVVPEKSSRRLPFVIVAGLAMLWLAIVISDSILFGPSDSSQSVAGVDNNANAVNAIADNPPQIDPPEANNDGVVAPQDPLTVPGTVDEANRVADAASPATPVEPGPAKASSPPKTGSTEVATTSNNATAVDSSSKSGAPAQPMLVAAVPGTNVPEPAPAEIPSRPMDAEALPAQKSTIHLMADNRTLFVFDEPLDRWTQLGKIPGGEGVLRIRNLVDCTAILDKRWFGVAAPFQATVFAADRGWSGMIYGNTLAQVVNRPVAGLSIWSGRLKLSVDAAQPWQDDSPPVFTLRTAGVDSKLTLHSKETVVAVEVLPVTLRPENPEDQEVDPKSADSLLHLQGADFQVSVIAVSGQASIQLPDTEQSIVLTSGKAASWLAPGATGGNPPAKVAENTVVNDGSQLAPAPEWVRAELNPLPEAEALNSLIATAIANGEDPTLAVTHLLADRNPQVGVRAVQVLIATRDIDRLLSAMFETLDEAVHRAAIDGLSQIANGSLSGRSAIRSALETRMPMSEVDTTLLLILGIGDAEARDPDFCRTLMDLLNNDRLATRTLAFYRIQKYSNDRLGYQPEAESLRRRDAVRRWQKFLDRNGGKLLP